MNKNKKYTKEYLINCLKSLQKEYISKFDIDNNKNIPSSSTFKRYFGSWSNAIKESGLKTGIITGRPDDKELVVSDYVIEIINGELLGDGSLCGSKNYYFSHSTANINYGEYLYNKLNKNHVALLYPEICKGRNNGKDQFRTRTSTNIFWTKLRNIWYRDSIKIVPESLKLTKETCLHWYLGDGYFENKTCKLSTCSFTYEEVNRLAKMLTDIGFKATVNKRSGNYYIIRISSYYCKDFLEWIGNPVLGYKHRWDLKE